MNFLRQFILILPLAFFFGCASHRTTDMPQIVYDQWTSSLTSDVQYAEMLHAGKTNELAQLLDVSLAQDAHTFADYQWPKDRETWRLQMLWAIERYYQRTGKTVPPDLARIFAGIPPLPPTSCEIKQQDLKKP